MVRIPNRDGEEECRRMNPDSSAGIYVTKSVESQCRLIGQWIQIHDCNGKASKKLYPEKYYEIQWHTQAGNITTNLKVKVYFDLPVLSTKKFMTWNCHVDEYAKDGYDRILGQDLLSESELNFK